MTTHNILRFIGSKTYMLDNIYRNLDYSKKCFLELFGGTGIVSLNLPNYFEVMIYNDIDDNLVNLFLQIKNRFDDFVEAVKLPYSRKILMDLRQKLNNKEYKDDFEKAVIYFYLINTCWIGMPKKTGWSFSFVRNEAERYFNKIEILQKFYEKLKPIQISNRDYEFMLNSIKNNNQEQVMIYADPPYFGTENYYKGNFSEKDHIKLAKLLNNLKSSIMISYYYFDGIEKLYPKKKWNYFEYDRSLTSQKTSKINKKRTKELLILNYNPKPLMFKENVK